MKYQVIWLFSLIPIFGAAALCSFGIISIALVVIIGVSTLVLQIILSFLVGE